MRMKHICYTGTIETFIECFAAECCKYGNTKQNHFDSHQSINANASFQIGNVKNDDSVSDRIFNDTSIHGWILFSFDT